MLIRHPGNLHINVVADKYDDEIEQVLEPFIYEIVCKSTLELRLWWVNY